GTKDQKAQVNTVDGDVIAKTLFEGQQIRGESKAALVKVIEQARQGFDEGQEDELLHRKYQEMQQHYFGELEKLTKPIEDAAKSGDKKPEAPKTEGESKP